MRATIVAIIAALAVVPAYGQSGPPDQPPVVTANGITVTAFTPDYQRPFMAGGGELRSINARASGRATVAVYVAKRGAPNGRLVGSRAVTLPRNGSNASVRVLVPCRPVRVQQYNWFTVVTSRNTLRGRTVTIKATSGGRIARCAPV